ncbi:uncharacterized protein LOC134542889 [Bacillus rossius redtenbacheri]|uniref:uncharacterized protein LOC134542889 n=1 Tax=Bacillus rossius redtenbacheri TaxID=93214 RepID=UPI002FDD7C7A
MYWNACKYTSEEQVCEYARNVSFDWRRGEGKISKQQWFSRVVGEHGRRPDHDNIIEPCVLRTMMEQSWRVPDHVYTLRVVAATSLRARKPSGALQRTPAVVVAAACNCCLIMVRVPLAALLLSLLFRAGAPLLCYVCDAAEDPSCADLSSSLYFRFRHLGKCKGFVDEDGWPIGRPLCYKTGRPGAVRRGCLSAEPQACLGEPCNVCDSNGCNGSAASGRSCPSFLWSALLPAALSAARRLLPAVLRLLARWPAVLRLLARWPAVLRLLARWPAVLRLLARWPAVLRLLAR